MKLVEVLSDALIEAQEQTNNDDIDDFADDEDDEEEAWTDNDFTSTLSPSFPFRGRFLSKFPLHSCQVLDQVIDRRPPHLKAPEL